MRTIREVLRLRYQCGLPNSDIAASCRIGETTVREYLRRAKLAGLTWPLPDTLNDAALDQRLYPPRTAPANTDRALPDWPEIHKQLKRKGVTLQLLAEEYRRDHPTGYAYSQFCKRYREWARTLNPTMIQEHKAGDKLFVDYAGHTMPITDPKTGEVTEAQIFVAALGASNYTFAEATLTQSLPDWIGSHIRCFAFLGGVPRLVVPDNLKSGVTSPCRYEPDINPTYLKLANHYGVAVVPARVRKPRDKSVAENAVLQVDRHILARLRNHTFHSLAELNQAIGSQLILHNDRATKSLGSSRTALFESIDRPALRPLPERPYLEGEWSKARVNLDYHVVVDNHRYSVSHTLIGERVDVHLTATVVEIYFRNERAAAHKRSQVRNGFTTVPQHMPPHHRQANWQEDQFLTQARKHGPHTEQLISAVLESRPVREQTYRSCLGILRLADKYGAERMEDAALRATFNQVATYRSVENILKNGLDRAPLPTEHNDAPPLIHDNIRGADYYNSIIRAIEPAGQSDSHTSHLRASTEVCAMLEHPTLDKLAALNLTGMLQALLEQRQMSEYAELSFEERLGLLVDREALIRQNRRTATRMKRAGLRQEAAVEDIDFRHPRGLDRSVVLSLASCQWIRNRRNCLITGPTEVGKTYLACALAQKSCREGFTSRYVRMGRLLGEFATARLDGSYSQKLRALAKLDLLVLDDWGVTPLSDENRRDLLEILDDRYDRRSTLVTSQIPVDGWHGYLADPTLADAILDRLVHNAHRLTLSGESMRRVKAAANAIEQD